ncbi:isoprenoid biosynthesis protein ElbB [bacterium CG17_big_fil_post_rev_8_21_14_2_50_64_8]|nr:MAG: isoprenoid biosynthesis protein ElbB [bacterium CG17_big_fil_post_rev_8_21_14_2_50_64_8]PJA74309.1 MAG: isoprenoid biosynthesis protein ElbB [bacterium CG_4_9_14_3_um_filter_65_15]
MPRVAVILSGCGVFDGSEIHEACAALLALDRAGAEVVIAAPPGPQLHVVDHLAGEASAGESRDILVESARIARGEIRSLPDVDPATVDAVLMPGGFGAAKNLCTFAVDGADCTVNPAVTEFLNKVHDLGRPIGAMCIAPVVLARIFGPNLSPRVTIGNDPTTAALVNQMGARHVDCAVEGVVVDRANLMVTTPAYMLAGSIKEVFAGAETFVQELLGLCAQDSQR